MLSLSRYPVESRNDSVNYDSMRGVYFVLALRSRLPRYKYPRVRLREVHQEGGSGAEGQGMAGNPASR